MGTLTYSALARLEFVKMAPESGQYYVFVLQQSGDRYTCHYPCGLYPVSPEGGVSRVVDGSAPMPVEEAWPLIDGWYRQAHDGEGPVLDTRAIVARLKGDDIADCTNALALLKEMKETAPPQVLMDAVEKHGRRVQEIMDRVGYQDPDSRRRFQQLAKVAIESITESPEPESVARMFDFYVANVEEHMESVLGMSSEFSDLILKMVAALPGPERAVRLERLFAPEGRREYSNGNVTGSKLVRLLFLRTAAILALKDVPGQDIDVLLEQMVKEPDRFGLVQPSESAFAAAMLADRKARAAEAPQALPQKPNGR